MGRDKTPVIPPVERFPSDSVYMIWKGAKYDSNYFVPVTRNVWHQYYQGKLAWKWDLLYRTSEYIKLHEESRNFYTKLTRNKWILKEDAQYHEYSDGEWIGTGELYQIFVKHTMTYQDFVVFNDISLHKENQAIASNSHTRDDIDDILSECIVDPDCRGASVSKMELRHGLYHYKLIISDFTVRNQKYVAGYEYASFFNPDSQPIYSTPTTPSPSLHDVQTLPSESTYMIWKNKGHNSKYLVPVSQFGWHEVVNGKIIINLRWETARFNSEYIELYDESRNYYSKFTKNKWYLKTGKDGEYFFYSDENGLLLIFWFMSWNIIQSKAVWVQFM